MSESNMGNVNLEKSNSERMLQTYQGWILELENLPPDQKIKVTYMGRESNEVSSGGKFLDPLKEIQRTMLVKEFTRLLSQEVISLGEIITEEKRTGEQIEFEDDPYGGDTPEPYLNWEVVGS